MKAALFTLSFFITISLFANRQHTTSINKFQHSFLAKDTISDSIQTIYESPTLIIRKLSAHCYQHISYLNTESFGKVECNGMIVINEKEAIVFDTPADDTASTELIRYCTKNLHCKIKAVVPTHFHKDCLGGLAAFHENKIPSYANNKTIALAESSHYTKPQHGFDRSLTLNVGDKKVFISFFGEGHTKDNVVAYFPADKILFGGCLIKEVEATKGYLGDANIAAWSSTVKKIKATYPEIKIVIPGHGEVGGTELLDYTITLFK